MLSDSAQRVVGAYGLRPGYCRWNAGSNGALSGKPICLISPLSEFLQLGRSMNLFELTRRLIDIESVTPNETEVGDFLFGYMSEMARRHNGRIERLAVEPGRDNVFVHFGQPTVTLSTHMDTVPPFIPSKEEADVIWGRGACDTKGIIASMLTAAEELLKAGHRDIGLLFVVGEERNSAGAYAAAKNPRGSRFIINGEPTENKLASGSKGALRYQLTANGKMAHSAYPELGESAIDKLLDALQRIRAIQLPHDELLGPSTLNIGQISGGRAPNVIPDQAQAELLIRVVGDVTDLRTQVQQAAEPSAQAEEILLIPALRLGVLDGYETMVASYTTDIPAFGDAWGKPFLMGPGTIHVAHTRDERIEKAQLTEAVSLYQRLIRQLAA